MTRARPTARHPVPSAVVVRHVHDWMGRLERTGHDHLSRARPGSPAGTGPLSSTAILADRTGRPDIARVLWRLKHDTAHVTVEEADMFISAIDPGLWHVDPDLARVFRQYVLDDTEDLSDDQINQWAVAYVGDLSRIARARLRRELAWLVPERLKEAAA